MTSSVDDGSIEVGGREAMVSQLDRKPGDSKAIIFRSLWWKHMGLGSAEVDPSISHGGS